jgi:hypothetical protein
MTSGRDQLVDQLASEEGIYGVILVAGMIVVSGAEETQAWPLFVTVVSTVAVFWAAHIYAGTVAYSRTADSHPLRVSIALAHAVSRTWGLLVSALIPASLLLLGATQVVPDRAAIWLALWTGVAVLAVLGYHAFSRQGASWHVRLLGALGTAAFGILMILLKAALH